MPLSTLPRTGRSWNVGCTALLVFFVLWGLAWPPRAGAVALYPREIPDNADATALPMVKIPRLDRSGKVVRPSRVKRSRKVRKPASARRAQQGRKSRTGEKGHQRRVTRKQLRGLGLLGVSAGVRIGRRGGHDKRRERIGREPRYRERACRPGRRC